MNLAWWNSLDTVSVLSITAKWAVATLGVLVLVLGCQEAKLRDQARAAEKARSEKEINEAHQKLESVTRRLAPRRLTREQKDSLARALNTPPKGKLVIKIDQSALDGDALAADFRDVLSTAGIPIEGIYPTLNTPPWEGIWIAGVVNKAPLALLLQQACATAGVVTRGTGSLPPPRDQVEIIIGRKEVEQR